MVDKGTDEERDEKNEDECDVPRNRVLTFLVLCRFCLGTSEDRLQAAPRLAERFNALVI